MPNSMRATSSRQCSSAAKSPFCRKARVLPACRTSRRRYSVLGIFGSNWPEQSATHGRAKRRASPPCKVSRRSRAQASFGDMTQPVHRELDGVIADVLGPGGDERIEARAVSRKQGARGLLDVLQISR